MLLTVHTLSQLAVSAKLLCLLMMVICGAAPSVVRSVRLYNSCSQQFVGVNMNGHVFGNGSEGDNLTNLTFRSVRVGVVRIFAEESKMYLCFNRSWRLIGERDPKPGKAHCNFEETMLEGYSSFQSTERRGTGIHRIGFSPKGRPLRYRKQQPSKREKCFFFLKKDSFFDPANHNRMLASQVDAQAEDATPRVRVGRHHRLRPRQRHHQDRQMMMPKIRHRNHHKAAGLGNHLS